MAKLKEFGRRISLNFVEYALLFVVKFIFWTSKVKFNDNELPKYPCVVLFWHGRLALMAHAYKRWWIAPHAGAKCGKVIISDHKDGEIITRVVSHFGIGAIRGSSSKGAARALIGAFREIEAGTDVIITPDGPRGPFQSVADGAVVIAQKKDLELYVLDYESDKFWQLKSWDKMRIPKPFSRINYYLSEPFKLTGLSLEEAKEKIKNKMLESAEKCEKME